MLLGFDLFCYKYFYCGHFIETLKWSESKQLGGYIFAHCITLETGSSLLTGFVVQSRLAVSLCQLASMLSKQNQNHSVCFYCYVLS